jgi:hypothetical protein
VARFVDTNDKDFIDRTGHPMSEMEQLIRMKYDFTEDEKFLMRENGWGPKDIFVIRQLKEKIMNGDSYGPDKNFTQGRY